MIIKGLQRLTLLDFPGRIACTVFTGGCNMRCGFCHNGDLLSPSAEAAISTDELLAFLDSRRGRLQGVCVSGGEPTLHPDLPELIAEIKKRGFEVKLDTNGTNPEMLSALIADGLVDYVAMDIKNSPEKYEDTCGLSTKSDLMEKIKHSVEILRSGRVEYEFRTTLTREMHSAEDIMAIGRWLCGESRYFLQTYRDEGELVEGGYTPYSREETAELLQIVRSYLPNAEIRFS